MAKQTGLFVWRQKHKSSFNSVSFLGLWLIPFFLSVHSAYNRMTLVWLLWSAGTGYYVYLATRKPLSRSTPRALYRWFAWLYHACYGVAVLGYFVVLLEIMGLALLFPSLQGMGGVGLLMMFYGLYYGVLDRDAAEWCTDHMASEMGTSANRSKNLPTRPLPPNICAICGDPLMVLGEGGTLHKREETFQLNCNHSCHEFCIRGWTMVGKKDTCPYPTCKEKVSLRDMFPKPWQKQTVLWTNLLDMLRYLIVWNPIILIGTQMLLTWVDSDWLYH